MECPVCFTNKATCKLVCGHSFCTQCTKEWWLKTQNECQGCPMCRRPLYFRGMNDKVEQWEDERREYMMESAFTRVFNELMEDIENDDECSSLDYAVYTFAVHDLFKRFETVKKSFENYDFDEETFYELLVNPFIEIYTNEDDKKKVFNDVNLNVFTKHLFIAKKKEAVIRGRTGVPEELVVVEPSDLLGLLVLVN